METKEKYYTKSGRDIIVSDFDGTLFFGEKSLMAASKEVLGQELLVAEVRKLPMQIKGRIYDLANRKYSSLLVPNESLIEAYRTYKKEGYEIIILSARGEETMRETREALNKYNVPYDSVVLAPDHSIGDGEWKLSVLDSLIAGCKRVMLFEDKQDNIDLLKQHARNRSIRYYLVSEGGINTV